MSALNNLIKLALLLCASRVAADGDVRHSPPSTQDTSGQEDAAAPALAAHQNVSPAPGTVELNPREHSLGLSSQDETADSSRGVQQTLRAPETTAAPPTHPLPKKIGDTEKPRERESSSHDNHKTDFGLLLILAVILFLFISGAILVFSHESVPGDFLESVTTGSFDVGPDYSQVFALWYWSMLIGVLLGLAMVCSSLLYWKKPKAYLYYLNVIALITAAILALISMCSAVAITAEPSGHLDITGGTYLYWVRETDPTTGATVLVYHEFDELQVRESGGEPLSAEDGYWRVKSAYQDLSFPNPEDWELVQEHGDVKWVQIHRYWVLENTDSSAVALVYREFRAPPQSGSGVLLNHSRGYWSARSASEPPVFPDPDKWEYAEDPSPRWVYVGPAPEETAEIATPGPATEDYGGEIQRTAEETQADSEERPHEEDQVVEELVGEASGAADQEQAIAAANEELVNEYVATFRVFEEEASGGDGNAGEAVPVWVLRNNSRTGNRDAWFFVENGGHLLEGAGAGVQRAVDGAVTPPPGVGKPHWEWIVDGEIQYWLYVGDVM